jgi:DNA-binding PadR family transcriptional regulator
MRQTQSIRYAILGLVSRSSKGVHGYALKRQCDRVLGQFWQLNFGEIYRVLDRLTTEDLIEQIESTDPRSRKVYRITDRGRQSLDAFILEPPTDAPRPLRQELAIKLLFAGPEQLPELLDVIRHQRELYARQLQEVGKQRRRLDRLPFDTFVTRMLIEGAELSVRAEMAWLETVAANLRARYVRGPT